MGLVCLGLALYTGSVGVAAKLLLIWLLVLVASSAIAYSIANKTPHGGIDEPERHGD
jgi:multicomponent Na+:H+ antiporter subunit G